MIVAHEAAEKSLWGSCSMGARQAENNFQGWMRLVREVSTTRAQGLEHGVSVSGTPRKVLARSAPGL